MQPYTPQLNLSYLLLHLSVRRTKFLINGNNKLAEMDFRFDTNRAKLVWNQLFAEHRQLN